MITAKQARETPELMIKHKEDLKNIKIFEVPWYRVFWRYPYLYREFSDRFDEMVGWDVSRALTNDPTLVLDLKNYLHKMDKIDIDWVLEDRPEMSLCMKYRDDVDRIDAAYYITFPHELDGLDKEEKRKMGKKIIEFLREEKT
jgi:hypothetical protein